MDDILDIQKDLEIKALEERISELENENSKLRILNKELGGDADVSQISDEEVICINEIRKLKEASDQYQLSTEEVKNFDLLNKNLKLIRGQLKRGKKGTLKKMSTEELMRELK